MTFKNLGLSEPLKQALIEKGYETPTPIQKRAIPIVLSGKDVIAIAQTGTGKTAAFALPILQKIHESKAVSPVRIQTLVLTPTRELAAQVGKNFQDYGQHLGSRTATIFGGVGIGPQKKLLRKGVDILVATPGRLLDLSNQGCVDLSYVKYFILDEADRMLDMGFIPDLRRIIKLLPQQRQSLLFSATFDPKIQKLAKNMTRSAVKIEVSAAGGAADNVRQIVYSIEKAQKTKLLCHLIQKGNWDQVLVFTRTKHGANQLTRKLEREGIKAAAIHGNKSQGARTRALIEFKKRSVQALVATDIASRGLDIERLPQVVNFDLPSVAEDYVHRVGRTGRAGMEGYAISLVSADEQKSLAAIEKLLRKPLPSGTVEGFRSDTKNESTDTAPKKVKKTKKNVRSISATNAVKDTRPGNVKKKKKRTTSALSSVEQSKDRRVRV